MKKFAVVLLASVALASCAYAPGVLAATECVGTQTECLGAWFDARFAEELAFSPMRQTQLGMKTDYDKLDDMSVEAAKRQIDWWQKAAAQMAATFDYDALSDEEKLSYAMFKFRAATAARSGRFMEQQYVLHQFNGSQSTLPAFLLSQHKVETESDMVAFIARLGALGPAIDQLLERAQANAAAGTRPPRFSYDGVIAESKKLVQGAPFDNGPASALWAGNQGHLARLVANGSISQDRANELRENARVALLGQMAPAYRRVVDWFTADRPNTDEMAQGVAKLRNGTEFYVYSLNK